VSYLFDPLFFFTMGELVVFAVKRPLTVMGRTVSLRLSTVDMRTRSHLIKSCDSEGGDESGRVEGRAKRRMCYLLLLSPISPYS